MTQPLIDLGEVSSREPSAAAESGRPAPVRGLLAALSLVLVALLAGGVPQPRLPTPIVVPARLGDAMFLSGDRMFLVSRTTVVGSEVRQRVVSTYALPSVRLLGRTTVTVSGAVNQVLLAGDTMLVSYQVDASGTWAVVAAAAGTGRTLWRRTARLVGVSPADGLVLIATDHHEMAADLTTGRLRWTLTRPANGFVAESGGDGSYPAWLAVLTDAGVLQTRDTRTGAVLAQRSGVLPPGRTTGALWTAGDLVMVDDGRGVAAYRLPGLAPVWRGTIDLSRSWMQNACGPLLCAFHYQRGMTALDPATGRELWRSDLWAYAEPVGGYLMATRADRTVDEPGLWILDPRTGRKLGDFGRWDYLGPAGDGRFYGKVDVRGEYRVHYGVLDPATLRVRLLGTADEVSNSCQTAAGLLVCRLIDASVALWPLR